MRFELTTSTLATWGSTTELHPQYGWGGWTRTSNLPGNNRVSLPVGPHPNNALVFDRQSSIASMLSITI